MPTCIITTDTLGRQAYMMDQGAMASLAQEPVPADVLDGVADDGWLHIATGAPLGYALVADAARRRGLNVALDPAQELRFQYDARSLEGLARYAQALFLNEAELAVACKMVDAAGPEDLLDLVELLVVTRGPKGASLYRPNLAALHQPAFAVPLVDPTGAGDALRAGWYAALRSGKDHETALKWGQAAAAICIQHIGAQDHLARPPEIDQLLGKATR
jgi:sugar/nucleoside kinase (ribokinase family)